MAPRQRRQDPSPEDHLARRPAPDLRSRHRRLGRPRRRFAGRFRGASGPLRNRLARRQNTALMVQQETCASRHSTWPCGCPRKSSGDAGRPIGRRSGPCLGRSPPPPAGERRRERYHSCLAFRAGCTVGSGRERTGGGPGRVGSKQASVPVPAAIGIVPAATRRCSRWRSWGRASDRKRRRRSADDSIGGDHCSDGAGPKRLCLSGARS